MFVRDFIHVGQPFEIVAPRFVRDPSWLAPIAEEAAAVARDLAAALDGNSHARSTGLGPVRVEVGPVRARTTSLLVPMWLTNEPAADALPDLAGDLEVAPVGPVRSLLAFGATYRRPARDPARLEQVERATEAGVRSFLNGIAAALGQSSAV